MEHFLPDYPLGFDMQPEDIFILACCNVGSDSDNNALILTLSASKLDWEYILKISWIHGIYSVIYKTVIDNAMTSVVPADVLQRLKKSYYASAIINREFLEEFDTILRCFHSAGIKLIPLKGIDLLKTVYPNNALRPLNDIDILVPHKDLEQAKEKLHQIGYVQKKTTFRPEDHYHSNFAKNKNGVNIPVELHWHVHRPREHFAINIDEFWSRAEQIKDGSRFFCRLSIEDNLLYTAYHCFAHDLVNANVTLKSMGDLIRLLHKYGNTLDWSLVLRRAQQYKLIRPVGLAFYFLEKLFKAGVPNVFSEELLKNGFQEEAAATIVGKRIFNIREKGLPSAFIVTGTGRHITATLSGKKVIDRIYIVFTQQFRVAPSFAAGMRESVKLFTGSIMKYVKLVFIFLFRKRKTRQIFMKIKEKREIEIINSWIQGKM